ncbi:MULTISPECIES: hypothetical protein [Pseudomonadaceae]|nr:MULTISPECIES: hypothetical protein [Pseudomonadaceae]
MPAIARMARTYRDTRQAVLAQNKSTISPKYREKDKARFAGFPL